jgi:hypothetical protein
MLEFESNGVKFRIIGTRNTFEKENGREIYHDLILNTETKNIKEVKTEIINQLTNPK